MNELEMVVREELARATTDMRYVENVTENREGLLLTMRDGSEFQVTITQQRHAR